MKITVFETCKPFSHQPGIRCLLPGKRDVVQAFPAKINEEVIPVRTPMKEWTVSQNLQQGHVCIRGVDQEGCWTRELAGKAPLRKAKLSFGVHKAQQMERVIERAAPEEFLPFWFALANFYPEFEGEIPAESLLDDLQRSDRTRLYRAWSQLFRAGFEGWMIPRLKDTDYHGFDKDPVSGTDPFVLVTAGVRLLQQMLVDDTTAGVLAILPKLPPELHCGRLIDLALPKIGVLSIEWSKKEIKKVILTPSHSQELQIRFAKQFGSCRVNDGSSTSRQTMEKPLKIEKGNVIYFDQFQH